MDKKRIEKIVNEVLQEEQSFLVELHVGSNNKITLRADSHEGMNMKRLKMINRKVEGLLDRDIEDFDLTVSSPGVDKPLLVYDQYVLNQGRLVTVKVKNEEQPLNGRMNEVNEQMIALDTKASKKVASKRIEIPFGDIEETKIEIEF